MKRIVLSLCLMLASMVVMGQTKSYSVEGNTYKPTTEKHQSSHKQDTTVTPYFYEVSGQQYPIIMSKSGSCFIGRTSNRTGKYYRQYLGEEVSRDICAKMGVEYKNRKKSSNQ
jgi:hypothetical protein